MNPLLLAHVLTALHLRVPTQARTAVPRSDPDTRSRMQLRHGAPIRLGPGPQWIRVEHGRIWLTIESRPDDHFLVAGEQLRLRPGEWAWVSSESPRAGLVLEPTP